MTSACHYEQHNLQQQRAAKNIYKLRPASTYNCKILSEQANTEVTVIIYVRGILGIRRFGNSSIFQHALQNHIINT